MRLTAIGNPTSHFLSPVMHRTNFNSLGLGDTYETLNIPVEDFHLIKETISKEELDGFNTTISRRKRIIPYLDRVDEQAISVGTVNTVLTRDGRWIGYNMDDIGYVKGLCNAYPDLESAYILVLRAGGANKDIAYELTKFVEPKLTVANKTMARFESWSLNISQISLADTGKYLAESDIIINATPAGTVGSNESTINLKHLSPNTLVGDIIYVPCKTPILEEAKRKRNHTYDDSNMFVYRGVEGSETWTGRDADISSMKTAVLQQLKGE